MKVFAYSYRKDDEGCFFTEIARDLGVELGYTADAPTLENAGLAAGYPYISIITTPVDAELMRAFHGLGVRMISTRTIGYDHIDLSAAKSEGIAVSNATYSPGVVADYTVMLMLMAIRNVKLSLERALVRDYSLMGLRGRELSSMTVGVIGTGKIGIAVLQRLSGFGCGMLACDPVRNETAARYAEYVDFTSLLRQADIISIHTPATDDNRHLISREAIASMKDGAVLVNTARGSLVDTSALIDALESGKISAAGLDAVEGEGPIFYRDFKTIQVKHREMSILKDLPNVVLTPHIAFYTDTSVREMVYSSLKSCHLTANGEPNPWNVL